MRCINLLFFFALYSSSAHTQDTSSKGDIACKAVPGTNFNSCQLFNVWHSNTGQAILVTSANKYALPTAVSAGIKNVAQSFLRTNTHPYHPPASDLFQGDAALAGQLDDFLNSVKSDDYFLVYFSRIHLILLHTLYNYLTKIYTTFNLTHIDTIWDYIHNEATQALNKKTLIINHLVNLIEAQANQSFRARFPGLPQMVATHAGFTMLLHDYGAELNLLIEKQEEAIFTDTGAQEAVRTMRGRYLNLFGKYLKFSRNFTQTLYQPDPLIGSTFVKHARNIEKIITAVTPTVSQNADAKSRALELQTLKTINPPLFFYQDEVVRILKIVPKIAQSLPKKSENVPWPRTIVQAAINHTPGTSKFGEAIMDPKIPIAYFLNIDGQVTRNQSDALELFATIPTLSNIHAQQLLPQPNWLNSYQGVMLMMRAILGDFTALLDPIFNDHQILDPCMKCIVSNAGVAAGIVADDQAYKKVCQECQTFLEQLRKALAQPEQPEVPIMPPDQGPDSGAPA